MRFEKRAQETEFRHLEMPPIFTDIVTCDNHEQSDD